MIHHQKTIAIICDKNPYTSFGRMALDLQKVLSVEFCVHIVWLTTPKYFPADIDLPQDSHKIHAPALSLGWLLFRRPLRKLLREIKPNSVLIIRPELGFLVREIHKVLPESWTQVIVHDMFSETLYKNSIKFKLINSFFIAPTREADGFFYNSKYTAAIAHEVMGLIPDQPIIGCPIDTSIFRPYENNNMLLKQKWRLDNYHGVCLNISLDEPRKNIATFFELAKARPNIAFVRVGPFSPWMKKWIDDNNTTNIIHHSKIPLEQLLELYWCADLFIYPSYLEGFGMPPLEALACGIPVVAAATSALQENLEGITPLINPPDRVVGYLEVIDNVTSGKNVVDWDAAKKLLERFTITKFGERVCSYLRSI